MRRNDSSHNWDRTSKDENPRRSFRRNDSENNNSRERKPFRRNFQNSDDQEQGERGERRSFNRNNRFSNDRQDRRGFSQNRRGGERGDRPERGERSERGERRGGFNRGERSFNREDRGGFNRERRFEGRNNDTSRRPRIKREAFIPQEDRKEKRNFSQPKPENIGKTRLNKYIANAGICSRREADVLISTGVITVNGEVITEMGYKVQPGDVVKYSGRELKDERKVYILLNKPKGFITTADDPQQRHTVMELIDDACSERVYPVGRLDRNTTGLLLFTNDGDLTKKLTHPSFGAQKVYNVELDHPVHRADFDTLLDGVELEDGMQKVDNIDYQSNEPLDRRKVGVSIHSGKNRIVRRLFESLGYEVKKLDRVYFAGLTKKNLQRGAWRFLTEKEIAFLKMDN